MALPVPYLDALVPSYPPADDLFELLRPRGITDCGVRVDPGALDEAMLNLIISALRSDRNLCLQVPSGDHDLAIALGAYLQLDRRGKRHRQGLDPSDLSGPIVVIGYNLNVTQRLKRIRIGAENLGQSLVARRVRGDGRVVDLEGFITDVRGWRHAVLYLNTSVGWPVLTQTRPELAILDATTLNPLALERAFAWCKTHKTRRILVVSDLGAPSPPQADDPTWLTFPWTPSLIADAAQNLCPPKTVAAITTNPLLLQPPKSLSVATYRAPAITTARRHALAGICAARRVPAPWPESLRNATRLLNLLSNLWGQPETADRQAIAQGRPFSIADLEARLTSDRGYDLSGGWAGFRETRWSSLRLDILEMASLLRDRNPRLDLLLQLINWAHAAHAGASICVRTVGAPAAHALIEDLGALGVMAEIASDDRVPGQVSVAPYSQRLAWNGTPSLELHLGTPPPWRRSALFAGSASQHVVALDTDESRWFSTTLAHLKSQWSDDLARTSHVLSLQLPEASPDLPVQKALGPLNIDERGNSEALLAAAPPNFSFENLPELFAAYTSALDADVTEALDDVDDVPTSRSSVLARGIVIDGGKQTYWLPVDAQVEILLSDNYSQVRLDDLAPGMDVLVAKGENRDGLFARLKLASFREADVHAAHLLLRRFRTAVLDLYSVKGTWAAVLKSIQDYGSKVTTQATVMRWGSGDSLAPDDVEDIKRVAWVSGHRHLSEDNSYRRLGLIASELRRMHRGLGRTLSSAISEAARGVPGENCALIAQRCDGADVTEVLEEFRVGRVVSVTVPMLIARSQLRTCTNDITALAATS